MNFLVTNVGHFRNKGNEAITKALILGVKHEMPSSTFTVLTSDLPYDSRHFWHPNFVRYVHQYDKISVDLAYRKADVVLSVIADQFCSLYGKENLEWSIYFPRKALEYKKPLFLIAGSYGPFVNLYKVKVIKAIAEYASLITARDSVGQRNLVEVGISNVLSISPPSFLLEPDFRNSKRIWDLYSLDSDFAVIIPSQGITDYSQTSYSDHIHVMQKLIRHLAAKGLKVLLVPHVLDPVPRYSDVTICRKLASKDALFVNLDSSAEELKALFSEAAVVVSERLHGAVASLSVGVPTLAIGYHTKYDGVLGDFFGFSELPNYYAPIQKMGNLTSKVDLLIKKNSEIRSFISECNSSTKKDAKRLFPLIREKA